MGHSVLFAGIIAITLFATGPGMGSLDTDNDDRPDVLVVVSASNPTEMRRTRGDNRQVQNVQAPVVQRLTAVPNRDTVIEQFTFAYPSLGSLRVIRC